MSTNLFRGKKVWLLFLILFLLQGRMGQESFAQPVREESREEENQGETGGEEESGEKENSEEESSGEGEDMEDVPPEPPPAPPLDRECITLSQTENEHGWIREDTIFTVNLPEDWEYGEAVPLVEYRKMGEEDWIPMSADASDPLLFSFMETDAFYDGAYQFRTGNSSGSVLEEEEWVTVAFRKDKEPPVPEDIRVLYAADRVLTAEEKQAASGNEEFDAKGTEEEQKVWFAGSGLEAVLYIRDTGAGTGKVSYSFGGKKYTAETGADAAAEIDGKKYDMISLALEEEGMDCLRLTEIVDKAGNRTEGITEETPLSGRDLLVIDKTAPAVRAEYPDAASEKEQSRYYGGKAGERETVTFVFEEAYCQYRKDENGEPLKPELTIIRNGVRLETEMTESWILWTAREAGLAAQIALPYEDGMEVCYQVEAVYRDAAGNPLTADEDGFGQITDVENGVFLTGELVLDARAPALLGFFAEGNCVWHTEGEDGRVPLYQSVDGPDIIFTFTINDGEKEWREDALKLQVLDLTEGRVAAELAGDDEALAWTHQGRSHTAVFEFDGEAGRETVFRLQISYRDCAGNALIDGRKEQEEGQTEGFPAEVQEEQGICSSGMFMLDRAAPFLGVTYTEAVRLVKDGKDYEGSRTPVPGCTSYYNKEIVVELTVRDAYAVPVGRPEAEEISGLRNLELILVKEECGAEEKVQTRDAADAAAENVTEKIQWKKTAAGVFTGIYRVSEEGDYRIQAIYMDMAGNLAEPDESGKNLVQGILKEGRYESPLLVLDRTPPVISLSYAGEPSAEYQNRKYFNRNTSLQLTVTDRNFRVRELKESLLDFEAEDIRGEDLREETKAADFLGKLSDVELVRTAWNMELPLETDANYSIPIAFTDLAGNAAVWKEERENADAVHVEYLTVDKSVPERFTCECPGGELLNYLPGGWVFSREELTLEVFAGDETAGIREIRLAAAEPDTEGAAEDESGKETVRTRSFQPSGDGSFSIQIPLEAADFKGTVRVEVYDWAGNCRMESKNFAVESRERHEASSGVSIATQTQPSRTVDGVDFYNTDVTFRLTLWDSFSGLRNIWYAGGEMLHGSRDYASEAKKNPDTEEKEIVSSFFREMTLSASANNENHIRVSAGYTDNAGYTALAEQYYHIDVTAPEITVSYDLNDAQHEGYYNQARTATVAIRERNFDERDVEFYITNTEGVMPEISSWSSSGSGDDTLHVCTVAFKEDGDYTFTLEFQDLAGNRAVYEQTDAFTIDRTKPELSVNWSGPECSNERYYAGRRTAEIDILEHNFGEDLIGITITAEGGAKDSQEKIPVLSGWRREGDHNTARIVFSQDGVYSLAIEGKDLAGNTFAKYETEAFVIDQTMPELEIRNIADRSANSGEVRPEIRWSDVNDDPDKVEIVLTGYQNGTVEWKGTWNLRENGREVKIDDFAYVREADDMYTLKAVVEDLAGNRSQASVSFSVNRFGSVYTFDDATEALAGKNGSYYTKQAQDIIITETNVDLLEFREILCSRDGKLRTLKEGEDYTVEENGGFPEWKQYTYTVYGKNFEEEGRYLLTLYSEDRAKNVSDTGAKGKKIAFAVDGTAPDILVSGVEQEGRYREGSRTLTIDVQDHIRLEKAAVNLNGQKTVYSASELNRTDGRITLEVRGENYWQKLSVTAVDAAGNMAQTEEIRFLVTPDVIVQFFMNRPVFYGTAAGLLVLETAVIWYLCARVRRRKKYEKESEKIC